VHRARTGGGPQFILANLLRLCGHGEHDDAHYIDPQLKSSLLGRDCLKVAEEHLLKQQWAAAADLETWRAETIRNIEEVIAQVQREPAPDPFAEDWSALATKSFNEGGEE
jgi:pyruvate dehydrogenase E1 component alpha subunit/2-oxoisovalerate dehydrogenase E1 component alpha subunit